MIRRSLQHYWRTHLAVVLGTALATLVLTGALFVGDSVKATLRQQAEARVGKADDALICGERFVHWPAKFEQRPPAVIQNFDIYPDTAGILMLKGSVGLPDATRRVNSAQVLGVDQTFWLLSPSGKNVLLAKGEAALNQSLAKQLGIQKNGELILKIEKPGMFSRDAPLSGEGDEMVTLRLRVGRIVDDAQFGRFGLHAGQIPPATLYIPLGELQEKSGMQEKVNVILRTSLVDRPERDVGPGGNTLERFDLQIKLLPTGGIELRSPRVFLENEIVSAAGQTEIKVAGERVSGISVLTYLVNELRVGDKTTPYSMVTATQLDHHGLLHVDLPDNEIAINGWLANDLGAKIGDALSLKYFVMGERRELREEERAFKIAVIVPMAHPQMNPSWMPDFPGLTDKESCREWEPGFDFDAKKIRDKDEEYWTKHRGTPKAFVNLRVGQEMWGNRWGKVTAIRYSGGVDGSQLETIAHEIDPANLGFKILPLRVQALEATKAPVDFGELFLSFSFFLIIAAAVLTGLLFTFSVEQRATEIGLLSAVGWPAKRIGRLFFGEGLMLATIGSVIGVLLAALYTKGILWALANVWSGAVGDVQFQFAPSPATFAIGLFSGILIAFLAMWLASRRLFKRSTNELLSGAAGQSDLVPATGGRVAPLIAGLSIPGATALLLAVPQNAPGKFFGIGALVLISGLAIAAIVLKKSARATSLESFTDLAARNTSRRRGRSLATIGVLGCGIFMVVAVASFRKSTGADLSSPKSGTAGFAFLAGASVPVYEDLNVQKGRETYALDDALMQDVSVVPFRVRDGDDASCLNLNRAVQPRLLGVRPEDLQGRFRFSQLDWTILNEPDVSGAVPAIVDANTLQWALQKKVGDVLEYENGRGEKLNVRIVATIEGSMMQGDVLIAERNFTANFPNESGYRFFLIDAPTERASEIREHLSRQLQDRGLEITPAADRLSQLQAVENTYISIFQVLGGLAVLLGSAGLGIVVSRNVLERRAEFALLEAVGFRGAQLRSLVFAEHRWLILGALALGAISALISVWPMLSKSAADFPWRHVAGLFAGMALLSSLSAWIATRLALGRSQIQHLRSE